MRYRSTFTTEVEIEISEALDAILVEDAIEHYGADKILCEIGASEVVNQMEAETLLEEMDIETVVSHFGDRLLSCIGVGPMARYLSNLSTVDQEDKDKILRALQNLKSFHEKVVKMQTMDTSQILKAIEALANTRDEVNAL